jgi:hypothetical protein
MSTGGSGASGGSGAAHPGDVYISSSIDISGVPLNMFVLSGTDYYNFMQTFIAVLLSQSYVKTGTSWPPVGVTEEMPEAKIINNISFTQYTDFIHNDPNKPAWKNSNQTGYFISKTLLLKKGKKNLKNAPTTETITPDGGLPFEIQIRNHNDPVDTNTNTSLLTSVPTIQQVDYMLYYLAKVGYRSPADLLRIQNAFISSYKYIKQIDISPTWLTINNLKDLIIYFTPPVQIGINTANCSGYNIPGSDKRTAIAVLHDRVECIESVINGINVTTTGLFPQYVAYDHGLGDLTKQTSIDNFPSTPVDWRTWYLDNKNNPSSTEGRNNSMPTNLVTWLKEGKVLIFKSPLGAGTLSIYFADFPVSIDEVSGSDDGNNNLEPKDGTYLRLCNGNNPYDVRINENNGGSAYDDRFIFYDKYYRVLANITPGESVRVTWCASLPQPSWVSIVGT